MVAELQEHNWAGIQREPSPALLAMIYPANEAQEHISRLPHFSGQIEDRGRLEIPGAPFIVPEQDFIVSFTSNGTVIENRPENAWPKIRLELHPDDSDRQLAVKLLIRPSNDTVEAEVYYTRVLYTIIKMGGYEFRMRKVNLPLEFRVEPESPEEVSRTLYRAKLYRKLAFIERSFKVRFQLPQYIPAEEMRKIEMVFRGITEGEFATRGSDITFENVIPAELDLQAPPFSEPGTFGRVVGDKEYLFGYWLYLGKVTAILRQAELANPRILKRMAEAPDQPVNLRFIVPDHQIIHRFSSYVLTPPKKRGRRLNEFIQFLSRNEPEELANSVREFLASDVSVNSAMQIASDWLMLNRLPDRFSAQIPELDQAKAIWRVPIYLVFSSGKHGQVGELKIDAKTGEVTRATQTKELLANAHEIGAKIIHGR